MEPVGKIALRILNKNRHAQIHRQRTGTDGRDDQAGAKSRLGLTGGRSDR